MYGDGGSILDFEVEALDLGVDAEALELADAFPAARAAGAGEIAADGAVLAGGVSGASDFDVAEVGFGLLLEALLLDDLAEVEVALEVPLLLGALVDALLVLVLARLALADLEALVVVELGHLVGVLEEVLLQVPQLLLDHRAPLVLVHLPHRRREPLVAPAVPRLRDGARHLRDRIYYIIMARRNRHQTPPCLLLPRLALLAALLSLASTKMLLQSPPELAEYFRGKYGEAGVPYSIANYGVVPYGKTISGEVGAPEFLEDCVYEEIPEKSRRSVLLVERNDCTFTQKSINVQKEGGKLAVIIDNVVEQPQSIVMRDDGKGHFVTIPTVLIAREDGLKILEYLAQAPILVLSFELRPTPRAQVALWVDVLDHRNYIFLRSFEAYYRRIAPDIDFSVAYPTTRCAGRCSENHCFYGGKYCQYPVGFMAVENAGKEVIREQLRQLAVFQQDPAKWWQYMLAFDDACDDVATLNECSERVLGKLGLKSAAISAKVDEGFGVEDNEVLRGWSELKYNNSILYFPSVIVNGIIYRGNLEPFEVFETICGSMTPVPSGCQQDLSGQESHLTTWIIFGVVSVVLFVLFLIVCFRRIARRQLSTEMNKKVNELVNEYISMYEVEKFKHGEAELKARP